MCSLFDNRAAESDIALHLASVDGYKKGSIGSD